MSKTSHERPFAVHLRTVALLLLTTWIVGGPLYRQVFGGKSKWVRAWVMFKTKGVGAVSGTLYVRDAAGEDQPLDRFELMGEPEPYGMFDDRPPTWLWKVREEEGFSKLTKRLCRALGPDADLRADARIATKKGWETLSERERNLCKRVPAPPADGTERPEESHK